LTGNQDLKSQGQIMQEKVTFGQRAKNTLIKPFSLNFKEPVIFANNLFIVGVAHFSSVVQQIADLADLL
jgi:hypothetical protein